MTEETATKLLAHREQCGGREFSKSTVQRDDTNGARYYRYRCLKCRAEIREELEYEAQEKAA